jgi:hypothetical protein
MPKPIRDLRSPKNECPDRWCNRHFDVQPQRPSQGSELALQLGRDPFDRPFSLQMRGDEALICTENTQHNMLRLNYRPATQRHLSPCVKQHNSSRLTESSHDNIEIVPASCHVSPRS